MQVQDRELTGLFYFQSLIGRYLAQFLKRPRRPANLESGAAVRAEAEVHRKVTRGRVADRIGHRAGLRPACGFAGYLCPDR